MASPASSDEGEIRDTGSEKATKSLPQLDGTFVDRQDRNRSRFSKSPNGSRNQSADRAHSSYSDRQPRGSKRSRDDDHYDRSYGDPRRFKVHYEEHPSEHRRRPAKQYDDLDRGSAPSTRLSYDDRDRYVEKRYRNRSRSPYRTSRGYDSNIRDGRQRREGEGNGFNEEDDKPALKGYEERSSRGSREQSVSKREESPLPADVRKLKAKNMQGSLQQHPGSFSDGNSIEISEPLEREEAEPLDESALIEQRRKRREAIKAKYRGSATPMLVQALQLGDVSVPNTPGRSPPGEDEAQSTRPVSPDLSSPGTPKDRQDPLSPAAFNITNDEDLAKINGNVGNETEEDGPSAADYDPTMDMREDKRRDDKRHTDDILAMTNEETNSTLQQTDLLPTVLPLVEEKHDETKDDFDMFASDNDDMFAEEPAPKEGATPKTKDVSVALPIPLARELEIGMIDNWDDPEGYYKIILGELLNGRYHVQSNLGRGMFSGVVRAMDVTTKKLVAIKIIRNNETMRKAGLQEIEILQKLNDADPDDKKHLIRLERHFEHKGHLCMVFENLSINLREVLKKFGRDVGINLRAVRAYAQQMFLGLSLMRKCNILHADLKPDNILVNEARSMLKICDLGSASDASENEITPYLVSRFYRAPEIILGMPYDFAIDIWSVGCTLYELYTGKILFTGRSNNQMLRSIMECRGKFTIKMLRKAQFAHIHFDDLGNFLSVEQDKLTGKDTVKTISFVKPTRDLRARLLGASKGMGDAELKELNLFIDLLERCLALNPEKRCTPSEALKHPFVSRIGR